MANFSQQVIWTALANGRGDKGLNLSIVVSPRLGVDGAPAASLDRFPVWLDWPSVVRKAKLTVIFEGKPANARLVSTPSSDIWRAIFTKETTVQDHHFEDLSNRRVLSYPFADLAKRVRDIMAAAAGRNGGKMPRGAELQDLLEPLAKVPGGADILKNYVADGDKGMISEFDKAGVVDLALFHAYHAPLQNADGHVAKPEDARAIEAGIDFHRLVSSLGQYRRLLRDTGLVLDLVIERPFRDGTGPLSVQVDWNTGRGVSTLRDGQPQTQTLLDGKRFESVPRVAPMDGRRLDLSKPAFTAEQIDVDGGIIKLTGTGASLASRTANAAKNGGKTAKDDEPTGLPTLRSAGIIVAEQGRGQTLSDRLSRATGFDRALQQDAKITLHAEDVMRGLHVDVEQDGKWYSLCRTDVSYDLTHVGERLRDEDSEGIVQLGVTEGGINAPPEFGSLMKLHEGLFNWDGWSLAAPRPGLAIDALGNPGREDAASALPVAVSTRVHPRSLPTLRFGASYRFRARAVDLAYNAEPWHSEAKTGVTNPVIFYRFEPLAPPVPALVRAGAPGNAGNVQVPVPGESLTRIVIRSFDGDMASPTDDTSERLLFPPRVSAEMAERHGVLDGPDGRPLAGHYDRLAGQDADLDEIDTGTPASPRRYPVADRDTPIAPYLPDPAAVEMRADMQSTPRRPNTGGRDTNQMHTTMSWGQPWPDHAPAVLRLREDPDDPLPFVPDQQTILDIEQRTDWDEAARTLTIALPKGETVLLDLGHSFPGKPTPEDFWGIAALIKERLGADPYQPISHAINAGQHWAVTPKLRLELVHATQRPLVTPQPAISAVPRSAGDTTADLSLTSPCHAESSADVTLDAGWIEPLDTGTGAPSASWKGGRVLRQTLRASQTPHGTVALNSTHQLGDTKYRRVLYRLGASSRFSEYFPASIRNDRALTTVTSDDVEVHVQNAAPPPPPRVSRSIPIYDWLRDTRTTRKASFRRSGLRVYLDRPWFATGFGEMLAAVLPRSQDHGGASGLAPDLAEHVSRWGADPIWRPQSAGKITTPAPLAGAFPERAQPQDGPDDRWPAIFPAAERDLPGALEQYQDLTLPDENGQTVATVDAAGHPVSWNDAEETYHADLMMDPSKAYQPFVSLAVARLHPVSAPGCHLSPGVRLPTVQILPARLAVARRFSTGWSVQIYGHRHENTSADTERPLQSVIRAELQRTRANNPDELDWETVDDANFGMTPMHRLVSATSTSTIPASLTANSLFPSQPGTLRNAAQSFRDQSPKRLFSQLVKAPGAGGGNRAGYRWRIQISEWERHTADAGVPTVRQIPGANERLIFAEEFEI